MQSKYKVGIDLAYMPRFTSKINNEAFLAKVLTDNEMNIFSNLTNESRKIEFLAGRFAAKEAYSKALKTGIGKFGFKDVEILKGDDGEPIINEIGVDISISHDEDYVIAIVIIGDRNEY